MRRLLSRLARKTIFRIIERFDREMFDRPEAFCYLV
jgi:hypothetical protein